MPDKDRLHDINIIVLLSSRTDMSKTVAAKKCLDYFDRNDVLVSTLGKHFLARLNQIANGNISGTCIICNDIKSFDGVLCERCMSQYSHGKMKFYKKKTVEHAGVDYIPEYEHLFSDVDELNDLIMAIKNSFTDTLDSPLQQIISVHDTPEYAHKNQKKKISIYGIIITLLVIAFIIIFIMFR